MPGPFMRRLILCILTLLFLLPTAALAKTVEPQPLTLFMDDLADRSVYVTVDDYDPEARVFTVTLYEPETFSREDIESLEVGDGIISDGKTWTVEKLDREGWAVQINNFHGGDYEQDALTLSAEYQYDGPVYRADDWGSHIWVPIGQMELSADGDWLFADSMEPELGWKLDKPEIMTAAAFAELYTEVQTSDLYKVGFDIQNCWMVFGRDGQPVLLCRIYRAWQ